MPAFDPDSFGFLITDVARLLRAEMDRRIADAGLGLTAGEGRALSHAARAGAVRQTVLAERLGVEAMTMSSYIDRLEARGLVERSPDPADRRAKIVTLTERAEDVLARIAPLAASVRAEAARGVEADDWARLNDMLKAVRHNLTQAKADPSRRESAAA